MVDKSNDNSLDSEIAKRLDDLFGEGDAPAGDENPIEAKDTVAEENKAPETQAVVEEEEIFDLTDEEKQKINQVTKRQSRSKTYKSTKDT